MPRRFLKLKHIGLNHILMTRKQLFVAIASLSCFTACKPEPHIETRVPAWRYQLANCKEPIRLGLL